MQTRTKIVLWLLAFFGPVWWSNPVGLRGRGVTVSKETTLITSPLKPDGTPDYIAWINEKYGKGVTPENNAAAILMDAWEYEPKQSADEAHLQQLTLRTALGIGARPKELPYVEAYFSSWAEKQNTSRFKEKTLQGIDPKETKIENTVFMGSYKTSTLFDAADNIESECGLPWTREQHPDVASWLEEQKPFLEIAKKASSMPHFFVPLFEDVNSPYWMAGQRRLNHFCGIYAMQLTGEGHFEEALNVVQTMQKLAKLQGSRGLSLMDLLTAYGGEFTASQSLVAIALAMPKDHPAWHQLEQMAVEPDINLDVAFFRMLDIERYMGLGNILKLCHPQNQGKFVPPDISETPAFFKNFVTQMAEQKYRVKEDAPKVFKQLDMNVFLRRTNEHANELLLHPEIIKTAKFTTNSAVKDALRYEPLIPPGIRRHWLAEKMADVGQESVLPALAHAYRVGVKNQIFHLFLPTTLALSKYNQSQGHYPKALEDLLPTYLEKLPETHYEFGDFVYQATANQKAFALGWVKPEALEGYKKNGNGFQDVFTSPNFTKIKEAESKAQN